MMTTRRKRSAQVVNQDDLTRIKGIGEARQQWLREKLNVSSFQELAGLSFEEIEARLKQDNQIVSRSAVESWIAQAAQLAGGPASKHPMMAKDIGWKPIASFVIEFQENEIVPEQRTKVHHVEADKNRMWSGIEHQELCAWMVQQLGGRVTELAEQSAETSAVIESPLAVEVSPSQSAPVAFSEKLQQVLAKAERMRLAAMPVITSESGYQATTATSDEHPTAALSQRLRAALAKADALSSQSM